ncbi:MAG: lysostaphin resistance A-like protein [Thermoplasmata archaeon]
MAAGEWGDPSSGRPRVAAPLGRYFLGVAITVLAILSQYFVPELFPASTLLYGNLPGDVFVVYGIPIIAFALLVGGAPLRDWGRRMGVATWQGLRFYGLLSLLALAVVLVLTIVYEIVDPAALQLLNRPNPALQQATGNPWFFVGFSFVVGAFEETIFRGFMFGYWRDRRGPWMVPAVWTSAVFAGVHLYYGTTYGAAAPLIFPSLFLMGFAFAATYRFSRGNLVVPAALHGAHDAAAFFTLISYEWGIILSYVVVLVGALIGLVHYLRPDSPGLPPIARLPLS